MKTGQRNRPYLRSWSFAVAAVLACVATACGSTDSSPPTTSTSAEAPGTWSAGRQITDAQSASLAQVSCASASFCAAVSSRTTETNAAAGSAFTYSGGEWSSGEPVDSNPEPDSGFTAISCPTATFCVAVAPDWTADGGFAYTYSSGVWSPGVLIDDNNDTVLQGVSCPTVTFCVAVDNSGYTFTDTSGVWSANQPIPEEPGRSNPRLRGVSCASPSFCMMVGAASGGASPSYGFILTDGTRWERTAPVEPATSARYLTSVSCPAKNFCVAVDGGDKPTAGPGRVYFYSSGKWSKGDRIDSAIDSEGEFSGLTSISCATTTFCAAAGVHDSSPVTKAGSTSDDVFVYANGSWSHGQRLDSTGSGLGSVSCPTISFCTATSVDSVYTYTSTARS